MIEIYGLKQFDFSVAFDLINFSASIFTGSLGIAPTRDCTHLFKIGFVVAGDGFYSYYIHQWNKSDQKRKIARKK